MSYLLWHRDRSIGLASSRVVLRAAEVPLFADAQKLRDRLEQLNEDAAQRIATAEQDARVQGYVQGREQATRDVQAEVAANLLAMEQKAASERAHTRGEVAALALEVVRKVLGQLPADGVLAALAVTAARDMLPAQNPQLHVHADDCDAVRARLAALEETDAPHFEVVPDAQGKPGACRLETEFGTVDASLDAQLDRIAAAWGVKS